MEFNFGRVFRADGGPRVQAIQGLRKLRELVDQYDVPYVVTADPYSHLQLRGPREVLAIGETIGFDREAIEAGLDAWGDIVERNRRRQSDASIEPGVRVERGDDV
jgi:ribonuclease P/MRP protein subunit RPP1